MTGTQPTQAELHDLKLAAQKLWDLDDNRLVPGHDYEINVQRGKTGFSTNDTADAKLFTRVSKDVWQKPTYLIFYHLLDNYVTETGLAESVTAEERKEINDFLDAVLRTRPLQYIHNYLVAKTLAKADITSFKNQLYQMWFSFYRRDGEADSCGFEHVFLGESDGPEVSGFHSWIQFWIEEAKGNIDYRGYLLPRTRGGYETSDEDRLLSVQFAWKGEPKPVSTFFIGTSPEFEFALYSLYFLAGQEQNFVEIGPYNLSLRCYRIRSKYGDKIGSTFAELISEDA